MTCVPVNNAFTVLFYDCNDDILRLLPCLDSV